MTDSVQTSDDGVDPVEYVRSYFTHLTDREISVLVGSITLLGEVEYSLLQDVLDLEQLEVEEKIGRLMQTDLLQGKFGEETFTYEGLNFAILKQHPNLILDDRIMLAYLKARYKLTLRELQDAFDLSYESVIYVLSRFVSQGLITPKKEDGNKFSFIVHFNYPKKDANEISDTEKHIVGIVQLKGKLTFDSIAIEIQVPTYRVQSTAVNLILSNTIVCEFELEKKLLGGINLYLKNTKFQIIFENLPPQALSDDERLVVGLIALRRELTLDKMEKLLNISEVKIIKILTRLQSTGQFNFSLQDNGVVSVDEKIEFQPHRSIDTLNSISSLNYRVLLGILKTQKKVSLNYIADKMGNHKDEILIGIVNLFLEGLIIGYFTKNFSFVLTRVKQGKNKKDITLERWERILFGALMAEEVLPWPKIGALLESDRSTVRNRVFEFIATGIAEIDAKDTSVKVTDIPTLPPLDQVSDLDIIEQQILGYLIAKIETKVSDIKDIFQLTSIDVFRISYFLSGSGLIKLKRENKTLITQGSQISDPDILINDLDQIYHDIIQYIQSKDNNELKINELANYLDVNNKAIIKGISYLVAHGFYKGKLENNVFIKKSKLLSREIDSKCLNCGTQLTSDQEYCDNCDEPLPTCSVCKGTMYSAEQLVSCPYCKHLAHSSHLREWLKIKGKCPICRNKLQPSQLLVRKPNL